MSSFGSIRVQNNQIGLKCTEGITVMNTQVRFTAAENSEERAIEATVTHVAHQPMPSQTVTVKNFDDLLQFIILMLWRYKLWNQLQQKVLAQISADPEDWGKAIKTIAEKFDPNIKKNVETWANFLVQTIKTSYPMESSLVAQPTLVQRATRTLSHRFEPYVRRVKTLFAAAAPPGPAQQ